MNTNNLRKNLRGWLAVALMLFLPTIVMGQDDTWSQATACPGWNNPTSFTTGSSLYYYQGRKGTANDEKLPNVVTGETGIKWTSKITSAADMATDNSGGTSCNTLKVPTGKHTNNYVIYDTTTQVTGYPVNLDPFTVTSTPFSSSGLPFVPTQYNFVDTTGMLVSTQLSRSIRIGDVCSGGKAAGLNYNMYVTTDNAMLFIYYSCVIEAPGHGVKYDPYFIIRVMKEDDDGEWKQVSDTLAYMVGSTPKTKPGGTVEDGVNGWHQLGDVFYKDWAKVSLNLSNLLYNNVRIEVMIRDCTYGGHFSYAYICGECRPMRISSSGCPPGMSTEVTKLAAPPGLMNYVWYASEYGYAKDAQDLNPGGISSHFTFRQLTDDIGTEADSAFIYHVKSDDFHITKRGASAAQTVAVDSVGNMQTFRCTMISALDPDKPFESHLYTNVQNTKPTMSIDTVSLCDGTVILTNESYVPGDPNMADLEGTKWYFYNNPNCLGASDSMLTGERVYAHYNDLNFKGVRVRIDAQTEDECYSEAIYPIRPLQYPAVQLSLSKNVLCDDEETTLIDGTEGSTERWWLFREEGEDSPLDPTDTVKGTGDETLYTRGFTHAVEPVALLVRNGLFYIDTLTGVDTVWCEATARDTVRVFLHPELEVTGDTIVCNGTLTDATVNAVGVEGCTYEWSTTLGSITGDIPPGNHLAVAPYAEKSTYYVKVTSPQGCVAWDSIHCYLVVPELEMDPPSGKICPGDVATLTGSRASSYSWLSDPVDPSLEGQDTLAEVKVSPTQTTTYTLIGHGGSGEHRCDASPLTKTVIVYPYPVPKVKITPEIVDSENPTITLRDESDYSVGSLWQFDGGEEVVGREVVHVFEEATGLDSVHVTLISENELNCKTVYPFGIPVNLFTAWLPNIFTPGSEDENAKFRLYTINDYDHFHIYVYNRVGVLVFDSDDVHFEWDGMYEGNPCPQGTYTYVMRYRKPGTYTIGEVYGSVTLVR